MQEQKQLPATTFSGDNFMPKSLQDIQMVAQWILKSEFFKGSVANMEQAIVKIMKGLDLGMSPVEAMESIYVVQGKTGIEAKNIAARIKTSGGKYDYKILQSTKEICRLQFYIDGEPCRYFDNELQNWVDEEVSFSMEDAVRCGYTKKWSSKQNREIENAQYVTNAQNMLFYRAVTQGHRLYCPDLYKRPVYSREELLDIQFVEVEVEDVTDKPKQNDAALNILANAGKKKNKVSSPPPSSNEAETEATQREAESSPSASAAPPADENKPVTDELWQILIDAGKHAGKTTQEIFKHIADEYHLEMSLTKIKQGLTCGNAAKVIAHFQGGN